MNSVDYSELQAFESHLFGYKMPGIEAALAYAVADARYALRATYCNELYGIIRIAVIRSNLSEDYRKQLARWSLDDPRVIDRHKAWIRSYGGPGWLDPPAPVAEASASPETPTPP
jgi:hypothetical protein